jgi:hypothetical protein
MKLSRLAIATYVALVFASGMVLGVFGQRLYTESVVSAKSTTRTSPEEFRKRYMAEMQSRLKLNADQVGQLNGILDETRARTREVHERNIPELQTIRKEQQDKIRAMLKPDQQLEYDKMRQEREDREKQNRNRGPGSGGR